MTAVEEQTAVAEEAGKSTHTVGDATRTLVTLPQLPYRSAVRAALYEADLVPDVVDAGVRTEQPGDGGELFVTVSWLPGHPLLGDPAGMDLLWSHLTGWSARADGTVRMLPVSVLAAPVVLAEAVLHLLTEGLDTAWKPVHGHPRWAHAAQLAAALAAFEDREALR